VSDQLGVDFEEMLQGGGEATPGLLEVEVLRQPDQEDQCMVTKWKKRR
jgi:hypothetical protein